MMIDMNYRRNPFSATFTPEKRTEIFQIPESKIIQLSEWPLYSDTALDRPKMKYLDTGDELTETFSPTPGADQFCVDYVPDPNIPNIADREGTGRVIVNATTGTWVIVRYWGIGRIDFKKPAIDDGIGYPYGMPDDGLENYRLLDYRGFNVTLYFTLSTYIFQGRYYSVMSQITTGGLRLYTAPINLKTPTAALPTNGAITAANYFKKDSRVSTFITSDNRIGVIWTNNANAYQGFISVNPMNPADMGGWTAITFPAGFNQYACNTQIGNQVYYFGANSVLNTPSNLAVKYNADTQTGTLLASLPNNWQYGACEYDRNGNIWLIGNMHTGYVGQVLKYSIWDNTYETKTSISYSLSFGTGTNTTVYWGAIPNGGALLTADGRGFLLARTYIKYYNNEDAGIGFPITGIYEHGGAFSDGVRYYYEIETGTTKFVTRNTSLLPNGGIDIGSDSSIASKFQSEERAKHAYLPIGIVGYYISKFRQINKYQNGIFDCGYSYSSPAATGACTIMRNNYRGE